MRRMTAAVVAQHGDVDQLTLQRVPVPEPAAHEVRVRVAACALNRADLSLLKGLSGPGLRPKRLPVVPGVDIAGTIDAVGREAGRTGWTPGQRVVVYPGVFCGECSFCRAGEETMCDDYQIIGEEIDGGLAEFVVVPARNLLAVPDGVPLASAAAAPATYTTAWRMLLNRGRLQPGDTVLIVGVGSGVATAAATLAHRFGARLYGTTSRAAKAEHARALGYRSVKVGYDSPFDEWLRAETGGAGADIVVDSVGARTWRQSIRSLERGGRLVICGATSGDEPQISIREIYQAHREILGAPCGNVGEFRRVMRLIFDGAVTPVIDRIYPLSDVRGAFERLQAQEQFGKILVRPADPA